ncbi:hypothetical protein J8F10_24135 [Gemmata sp. G18]|uniref:Uncharacterized protein n=1 Tax=Gemmata palustris TaxID=2822762 RepID=A0ABS5BXG2_9BACT|nr:hypothetical protein [Gemmata palustris]MBP3958350.1 hypothetical protein [Gemmata palustris]
MRDFTNRIQVKRVISPVTQTNSDTALVGQIIDRQGFESVTFVIATGGLTDADATFTVLLEEGDNSALSDNTAVADADMISQSTSAPETAASFTFTHDDQVRKLGYIGTKRYLRLTITPSGNNSGAAPLCAMALLANATMQPVVQATA